MAATSKPSTVDTTPFKSGPGRAKEDSIGILIMQLIVIEKWSVNDHTASDDSCKKAQKVFQRTAERSQAKDRSA